MTTFYSRHTKRLLDLALGAPILFRQLRPGRHGSSFVLHKFRTMNDATDEYANLLADSERLTPSGGFQQRISLHESPDLAAHMIHEHDCAAFAFPNDPVAFIHALEYLATHANRRQSIGHHAQRQAETLFDQEQQVTRLAPFLERLV